MSRRTSIPGQPVAMVPDIQQQQMDRRVLQYAADCSVAIQRRAHWRKYPADWCRERVHIEPSWKILAARALNCTVEEIERQYPNLQDKQIEILESVRDNIKTHVRSGHQIGKTLIAGCAVLWFLDCFRPSYVITTSATWTDVEMKLWGTIRDLYEKNGSWFGVHVGRARLNITNKWWALGLSPERVEPFQGHNARHVLVVFDEGSSIDQKFSDAADAEATRLLEIGNPLIAQGPFYQHSRSSEYHHIQASCLHHPNIILKLEIIPGGPRLEWVESRKQRWGERSPLYLGRVAGEFPEEAEDTLFPLTTIRACFELYKKVKDLLAIAGCTKTLGLDVARAGGDQTEGYASDRVMYKGREIKRSRNVLSLPFTDHHATRLKVMKIDNVQQGFDKVNVDAGGEGSGLADELPHAGVKHVNRILFGANPAKDEYFNCRAEMYWQLSIAMKGGWDADGEWTGTYAIEPSDDLEEELSVTGSMRDLKEKSVKKKKQAVYWLPPKEEIKEVLGRSPDKADSLCLENYRGKTYGMFEKWERDAKAQNDTEQTPAPQDVETKEEGDTASPKRRRDVYREKVVENELMKSAGGRKPITLKPADLKTCPQCNSGLHIYSNFMECGACGWKQQIA